MMRRSSWLLLPVLLPLLASCAAETDPVASVPAVSAPEQLASRLPAQAAGFHRGITAQIQQPGRGVEVAYATTGRGAAGFVQVMGPPAALPDGISAPEVQAEFQRWMGESARGAGPHRRLRVVRESTQPATAPLFRCAEMEGSYGRQPVQSMICVGAAGGQMLRLRVSMPRREPPAGDAQGFIREVTAALRARS